MPNSTTNLGLNTFLETDVFDVDLINENFQILDIVPICTETGTMTSLYSGGVSGEAVWRYKRFNDGTIELNTVITLNSLIPNTGSSVPYYTSLMTLNIPTTLSSVYDVHIDVASNNICWPSIIATSAITSSVKFYILSKTKVTTTTDNYKAVYVQVKGVEST